MDELTSMVLMTVTIFAGILLLDWVCRVDDAADADVSSSKSEVRSP